MSGQPWGRTAQIICPDSWTQANNVLREYVSVYIEPIDTRRYPGTNQLDLRIEKEFKFGRLGRLGLYADFVNILGDKMVSVGMQDVYRYAPSAPEVSEPNNRTLSSSYKLVTGVSGTRSVRLSVRYNF